MKRNMFSTLSILCLLLTFLMFGYDSTKWYGSFFKFLSDLSIFTPFILGGIGMVSTFLGIKKYRFILVVLHSFLLLLILGIYIKALYGFY